MNSKYENKTREKLIRLLRASENDYAYLKRNICIYAREEMGGYDFYDDAGV